MALLNNEIIHKLHILRLQQKVGYYNFNIKSITAENYRASVGLVFPSKSVVL